MKNDPRMSKPYIRIGRRSDKGFNTTTVRSRADYSVQAGAFKSNVNTLRVNKELMRHKLAVASFVSIPRLRRTSV